MAKKQQATKFPKRLFVNVEDDDLAWFNAHTDIDGKDDGAAVAIYELREIKRMKVTKDLV